MICSLMDKTLIAFSCFYCSKLVYIHIIVTGKYYAICDCSLMDKIWIAMSCFCAFQF